MSKFFGKSAPFDADAFVAAWTDAPEFFGKRKVDGPIENWLDEVKAGCAARGAPPVQWPGIARRLMGPKAQARLAEYERVLGAIAGNGEAYAWTWEKFRVAMASMGWKTSSKKKQDFTIAATSSSRWWVVGDKTAEKAKVEHREKENVQDEKAGKPAPIRTQRLHRREQSAPPTPTITAPTKSAPSSWRMRSKTTDDVSQNVKPLERSSSVTRGRRHLRTMSDTITAVLKRSPSHTTALERADITTVVAEAPLWLANAAAALEFLSSEYPRAMSTLAALLITAGSIPVIVASGGAGIPALAPIVQALGTIGGGSLSAVLAGHSAQAVGAIAVGLGNWLNALSQKKSLFAPRPLIKDEDRFVELDALL